MLTATIREHLSRGEIERFVRIVQGPNKNPDPNGPEKYAVSHEDALAAVDGAAAAVQEVITAGNLSIRDGEFAQLVGAAIDFNTKSAEPNSHLSRELRVALRNPVLVFSAAVSNEAKKTAIGGDAVAEKASIAKALNHLRSAVGEHVPTDKVSLVTAMLAGEVLSRQHALTNIPERR